MADDKHLYEDLLGPSWAALPAITRALHSPAPRSGFSGRADIRRGGNAVARWMAGMLGLPEAGADVPARVEVSRTVGRRGSRKQDNGELLERWYDGRHFATLQYARAGLLCERFGPFTLKFRLSASENGIDFHRAGVALWGVPLPGVLAPRVTASERAEGEVHRFDVRLDLPFVGLIIAYRGRLEADPS